MIFVKRYPRFKDNWIQTTGATIINIHTQHYALERWMAEVESV